MAKNQSYLPRAFTISDFVEWSARNELTMTPKFQRRQVWSDKARSYLIDTILSGRPMPIIYLRQTIDPETRTSTREVVDGQQRLSAIFDFIEGKFAVKRAVSESYGGLTYGSLSEDHQRDVLGYELSVDLLVGATDADVLDIFSRINTYTITLNAQEKLNAKHYGEFKQAVYGLGRDHLEFWRANRILTDPQVARMAEAELTSELVIAMLAGLQDKKKTIAKYYEDFDDKFPARRRVVKEFRSVIDAIGTVVGDTLPSTPFRRRTMFYSLFCVFYDALFGLPGSKHARLSFPERSYPGVRAVLVKLGAEVNKREPSQRYVSFKEASARQTDNIRPRRTRHQFIWDAIQGAATGK